MERHLVGPWQRLVAGKERVLGRAGEVEPERRGARPPAGGWSPADVIEHLVLAEGGMASALAKAPSPAKPRKVAPGRWSRFLLLRLALKGGFRFKAPTEAILPTRELPWHALLSRWEEQRRGLEEWLLSVDPRILDHPRFKHPIIGWLSVPQALTFAADHLDHHVAQIDRLSRGRTV